MLAYYIFCIIQNSILNWCIRKGKFKRSNQRWMVRVSAHLPANMTYWRWDDKKLRIQNPEEDAIHLASGEIKDYGFIQLGVKEKNTFHARVVVQRLSRKSERKKIESHTQVGNRLEINVNWQFFPHLFS